MLRSGQLEQFEDCLIVGLIASAARSRRMMSSGFLENMDGREPCALELHLA